MRRIRFSLIIAQLIIRLPTPPLSPLAEHIRSHALAQRMVCEETHANYSRLTVFVTSQLEDVIIIVAAILTALQIR